MACHGNNSGMPFLDPEVRRAYLSGYQKGFALDATISLAKARRGAVAPFDKTHLNEAWKKGFNKGLSNRQGEGQKARKAEWYQANKERLTAKERAEYRQQRSAAAMQALKAIDSQHKPS